MMDFFPSPPNSKELARTPYWPIIAIVLSVFLVRTENGSQNCTIIRNDTKTQNSRTSSRFQDQRTQDCNHNCPLPEEDDTPEETIDKMIKSLRRHHTAVGWRRAMLASILVSIIILMWLNKGKMVHGLVFFITAVIVFTIIYFTSVWLQSRWFEQNDFRIEQRLRHLDDILNKD